MQDTNRFFRLTAIASGLAMLGTGVAHGNTLSVANCADTGSGSLRAAIAGATSGDTIVFSPTAAACGSITLTSGQLQIDVSDLTITGPTFATLTIDGNHTSRIFHDGVTSGTPDPTRKLSINNLTLANGAAGGATMVGYYAGGCVDSDGEVLLQNSTITGCTITNTLGSAAGGGIASYSLQLHASALINNHASAAVPMGGTPTHYLASGGAADVRGGNLIVDNSVISGNQATLSGATKGGVGGGITFILSDPGTQTVSLVASTFSNNSVPAGIGGGVFIYGYMINSPATIDRCTFSANSARSNAGLFFITSGFSTMSNTTVSGNQASEYTGGAAFYTNATILNTTIAGNTATVQTVTTSQGTFTVAAGLVLGGALLQNTIIARNTITGNMGSDLASVTVPVTGSHNLIISPIGGTTVPADTSSADPLLAALANNGGPTMTRALLSGSPAIDAGCATSLKTDQRGPGYPRVWGPQADIGAYEFNDPAGGDVVFADGFSSIPCPG